MDDDRVILRQGGKEHPLEVFVGTEGERGLDIGRLLSAAGMEIGRASCRERV